MKPKFQNQRLIIAAVCALAVIGGVYLLLGALGDNKQLFINPDKVVATSYIQGQNEIKVGGLVVQGSVKKGGGLITTFSVVNFTNADPNVAPLRVIYEGVLPDLFAEGKGLVMTGRLGKNGVFKASSVLAKHDENYMPKLPKN